MIKLINREGLIRFFMLQVDNLNYFRRNKRVIENFCLSLKPNNIVNLIGNNGAGKTTILKLIAGLLSIDTVDNNFLKWQGKVTTPRQLQQQQLIYYLEFHAFLTPGLTVIDYLKYLTAILGISNCVNNRIDLVLKELNLYTKKNFKCNELSSGLRQKLNLSILWLYPAKVWLLDEPFVALDLMGKQLLLAKFKELTANGAAILFSSQALDSDLAGHVNHVARI